MAGEYTFLGRLSLEPGTWADWFSGSMSALAVAVAVGGYGFSEWQRRRDQKDTERQAGRQIGVKLLKVLNGTLDVHRHLWAEYRGPPLGGEGANELWRTIQPLIGLQDEPLLALDGVETNLLVKADATDFLMEMMLATTRYQSIISSMKEYQLRYEAIYAMAPPPVELDGQVGRHVLTHEQFMRIKPYSLQLETIIQHLRAMTAENVDKCNRLVEQYHPIMKGYFREKFLALGQPSSGAGSQ